MARFGNGSLSPVVTDSAETGKTLNTRLIITYF